MGTSTSHPPTWDVRDFIPCGLLASALLQGVIAELPIDLLRQRRTPVRRARRLLQGAHRAFSGPPVGSVRLHLAT
jgi:hypothetical protein